MLSCISLDYGRFFKTAFEKSIWDLSIFECLTTTVTVVLMCNCCSSFPFSWRSQRLRNVDAEAWSKLSVFRKADVCFSTQSLIAQKKLGRVFAPACYLLSTWFSFEDFFFSNLFESTLLFWDVGLYFLNLRITQISCRGIIHPWLSSFYFIVLFLIGDEFVVLPFSIDEGFQGSEKPLQITILMYWVLLVFKKHTSVPFWSQ